MHNRAQKKKKNIQQNIPFSTIKLKQELW
jgi:hypothetical protein